MATLEICSQLLANRMGHSGTSVHPPRGLNARVFLEQCSCLEIFHSIQDGELSPNGLTAPPTPSSILSTATNNRRHLKET